MRKIEACNKVKNLQYIKGAHMKSKALIILTVMAVLLEAGSITAYAADKTYTSNRLGGTNRIETAVKIASEYNNTQVPAVIVTTANEFGNALVGSTLSAKCKAPILLASLTAKDSKVVLDYIKGHLATTGTVYILGDTGSVSTEVENAIKDLGYTNIKRLAGANKEETFKAINDEVNVTTGTPVFIATEDNFPDALSASGIAGIKGYPILLSSKDSMSQATIASLTTIKPTQVFIAGGTGVIDQRIPEQIMAITGLTSDKIIRLSGADRYETSLMIAKHFDVNTTSAILATGNDFPDALAGSSLAVKKNAPIILMSNDTTMQKQYLDTTQIYNLTVLGGEGAVPDDILKVIIGDTSSISSNTSTAPTTANNTPTTTSAISNSSSSNNSTSGTTSIHLVFQLIA